ncbi:UDP-forming cellulose synthase catalytic subunit [Bosea sp. BK604]|uniref:UDP-forming cellulose synthase catalytic subunit n=1 Tax=Bosea sp. BK604 TaxID=2512180 RepID=UPI00104C381C|nr:UDP-forming cellulose synthase catalytic subunit [Bosea sp. BK604]TCR65621.1 cellulose synthase (UDP-forming) [Bosea sp. BK604]
MGKFAIRGLWVLIATIFTVFVTQPIGIKLHFMLSLSALAVMLAISTLRLAGIWRHIFLALASMLIIRYIYWRVTETIPDPSQLLDFIPGVMLIAAELYCIGMLGLGLFVNAQPVTRPQAPQLSDQELPTVDVFVPSYNEDQDLVAVTLAAAKALDYPGDKLTVYLLDDGGTDEKIYAADPVAAAKAAARRRSMQTLCAELGVRYLTRQRNLHAKAGNLNNGLANSTGELVVVFDADHVPAREFLRETIGFFGREPKLFLVQTPHFFVNPDPLERNLSTFAKMPSENEMFYGAIQKGLDSWNAAFFCGSAAVLRRTALDEVGGFAGVTITEDCETALELHARGWKSLYVQKPLIAGLQPETFEAFVGQRSRWGQGMMQIFMLKNPLFKRGLSLAQKLCYLSSNLFWWFPFSRLIFMISPLFFILFNLQIYDASPQDFVAYTLTYIAAVLLTQNYLYGRLRWPWISELYEYVQSVYLAGALASAFLNPRAPKFNVTQKGTSLSEDNLSRLALPFYVIFGVLVAATIYTVARYVAEPASRDLLFVVGIWNIFNTVLAGLALGVVSERRERRSVQRLATNRRGELLVQGQPVPVLLMDASIGGLKVKVADLAGQPLSPGRHSALIRVPRSDGEGVFEAPVTISSVRTVEGARLLGLRFSAVGGDRHGLVADVAYGDLAGVRAMRAARHRQRNLVLATLETAIWGIRETARGLFFALFRRTPTPAAVADVEALPRVPAPVSAAEPSEDAAIASPRHEPGLRLEPRLPQAGAFSAA